MAKPGRARSSSLAPSIGTARAKDGPFVALNCAAVPEQLLESELFGHVRGAFTDARTHRDGLFVRARGGTVFLDEIGDMPQALQAKLLRALEERFIRAVGSDDEVPIDVRVVAATHRDLESEVERGHFRADLFYRLEVVSVDVPPLRDRGGDILLLAQRFVEEVAGRTGQPVRGISHHAARRLLAYRWPGNVRELRNAIERAVVLTEHDQVGVEDLPSRIRKYQSTDVLVAAEVPEALVTLEEVENRYIQRVLASVQGNRARAARILGLDRKTLYRRLKRLAEAS